MTVKKIFHSLLVVLLCAIVAAAWQPAYGQSYPSKPIRMIIPYPPGGGADTIMRPFVQYLAERLGQQIVVDNRGGGGGAIGMEAVAHAVPDGYTIVTASPLSSPSTRPSTRNCPTIRSRTSRRSRCSPTGRTSWS